MRRILTRLLFFLALNATASSFQINDTCSTEGYILGCSDDLLQFLYCEWGTSKVAGVKCPNDYPDCSFNPSDSHWQCANGAFGPSPGNDVDRVSNTGDVMSGDCVLFNIGDTSHVNPC